MNMGDGAIRERASLRTVVLAAFALAFPFWAPDFWVVQIAVKSLWLAIVAMSLIFLASRVGMISLAQVGLSGVAGYAVAILTVNHGLAPLLAVPVALIVTVAIGGLLGLIGVRTYGIYFLMITLAYGVAAFFFAQQSRELTNGHTGINGVSPPAVAGLNLRDPTTFYFVALTTYALCRLGLEILSHTTFGVALQGVRDNPLRMRALGFAVPIYRVLAFAAAALIAAIGGVLAVWYNGRISPGSIDLTRTIDVLVIAVIGGLYRLKGALIGAVVFTVLSNYANQFTPRYNTVIGLVFILVLLLSPTGITGLFERLPAIRNLRIGKGSSAAGRADRQAVSLRKDFSNGIPDNETTQPPR